MAELNPDDALRRNQKTVAVATAGVLMAGCCILGFLDRTLGKVDFGKDDVQSHAPPSVSAPRSIDAQAPFDPAQGSILLGEAQRRVKKAMQEAGVPILGIKRSGYFNPSNEQQLRDHLADRAEWYSDKYQVSQAMGAAVTNCSALLGFGRGDNVPEGMVGQVQEAFANDKVDVAAQGCEGLAVKAWRSGVLVYTTGE